MLDLSQLLYEDETVKTADGFDDAFVTITRPWQTQRIPVAVYSREKCIDILIEGGCDREEAEEYFEFNVSGAYVGPQTPIFI